jgi:hypothetical protein
MQNELGTHRTWHCRSETIGRWHCGFPTLTSQQIPEELAMVKTSATAENAAATAEESGQGCSDVLVQKNNGG